MDLVLFPAKDADLPTDVEAMDHKFEALQVKDPQREINAFGMTKARIQPLNLGSTTSSRFFYDSPVKADHILLSFFDTSINQGFISLSMLGQPLTLDSTCGLLLSSPSILESNTLL